MRHRALRIFLLLLATVWYGAILPGHERGIVQLPGAQTHDGCCVGDKPVGRAGEPVPVRSPSNCAVCKFMGTLSAAPPPDLGIAPLGPTEVAPALTPTTLVSLRVIPTYLGRAPPAAA